MARQQGKASEKAAENRQGREGRRQERGERRQDSDCVVKPNRLNYSALVPRD